MSGLYNVIFGTNPMSDLLLATLKLRRADVGRFRDCFISEGQIAVYTRNGGGNRDDYQDVFDALREHPQYVRDVDDDFDCTYATIYFRFPDEFADDLRKLDSGEKFDPDERWQRAINAIKNMKVSP